MNWTIWNFRERVNHRQQVPLESAAGIKRNMQIKKRRLRGILRISVALNAL